ncbi:hypothetical protein JCM8097_003445 [Rhodosporidiobolus ruineniae]
MPLDASLYTLLVRPRLNQPGWVDFIEDVHGQEETGREPAYTAVKDPATGIYTLLDPLSSSPLGSHSLSPPSVPNAPPNPRHRLIRLSSPEVDVRLTARKGMSWCWTMEWEGTGYEWKRDIGNAFGDKRGYTLEVARKPDPNFPVVSFSPKRKDGSLEVYDHNLARVDPPIQDKKGLEIATLLALSFFLDHLFNLPSPSPSATTSASATPLPPVPPTPPRVVPPPPPAVPRPPVEPPRRKSSSKALEVNEVEVVDPSPAAIEALGERCLKLFEDPTLLYLLLFARSPACVPAVASLAEQVKRRRYKASGEEVLLFVDDGDDEAGGGAGGKGKCTDVSLLLLDGRIVTPPSSLRIYLSRIQLDELLPNYRKRRPSPQAPPKPPIRPPIMLGSSSSGSGGEGAGAGAGTGGGKLRKQHGGTGGGQGSPVEGDGNGAEGGSGWRSWFGGGGR